MTRLVARTFHWHSGQKFQKILIFLTSGARTQFSVTTLIFASDASSVYTSATTRGITKGYPP